MSVKFRELEMSENILFYFVFLSQIFLLSFYYPKEIVGRLNYVFNKYPPAKYPKLYVKPIEEYKKKQRKYQLVNNGIVLLGLLLLIAIGVWDFSSEGYIAQYVPWIYFMIQALPLIFLEVNGYAYFKSMRNSAVHKIRKAALIPRRLFNFVSPMVFAISIILIVSCLLLYYSMHELEFHPRNDTFVIAISLIFSNLLFGGIIFWNIYGKKLDPYQASKDRLLQIEFTVKSMVFSSIAASIFLMVTGVIAKYNLDYLEPTIMSLYLQFIVFIGLGYILRKMRLENIDFEVYREETTQILN
jgi:hypothetical protein